jgi:hypothetical protein
MGLANSSTCEQCYNNEKIDLHVLCDCEAIAELGFHHLGSYLMKPSHYLKVPLRKVLHFI